MTVLIQDPDFTLHVGDALEVLRGLPDGSVHCCVTSPPYWGLRDYGTGSWDGGDAECDHRAPAKGGPHTASTLGPKRDGLGPDNAAWADSKRSHQFTEECGKCGATRVDRQLGLEPTPEEYVSNMVAVFREVRRVLRRDGTCWLNLGDSYSHGGNGSRDPVKWPKQSRNDHRVAHAKAAGATRPKDMIGIPWKVAFALQADGWYLRSDIIWSKPNPMPESVTDRPTKAHEFLFLLTKAPWNGPDPGQFRDISDEDARWLALLFDTEGNIVIKRADRGGRLQFGAQMAFANCSRDLLERARGIVGMGSINVRDGKNAPVFYWQLAGRQARDLLYRIYPFLIVKQRQARVAIHMQDVVAEPKKRPGGYRTPEHEAFLSECWQTVKALNQFGDPDLSWVPEPRYGKWGPTRYFYDADAIREPSLRAGDLPGGDNGRADGQFGVKPHGPFNGAVPSARNRRSVWEIATEPYPDAHFATFPQALVEPCILAGTSERGCCPECGAPWERETDVDYSNPGNRTTNGPRSVEARDDPRRGTVNSRGSRLERVTTTTGWRSTCDHDAEPVPAVVLDCFLGSGTTALVARRLGRKSIGIELSPQYAQPAARRLQQLSLLTA